MAQEFMTFPVQSDVREQIKREAERLGYSASDIIRTAIREYFERRTPSAQVPQPVAQQEQVQPQ
jgi:predicted transcriptional regulator